MKIGFIGLGTMGYAMAANLIKAGHSLTVWNRSPAPCQKIASLGAKVADHPIEAASNVDVLINMLANDHTTTTVITDKVINELAKTKAIYINMATVSVEFTKHTSHTCKQKGVGYIAAPVLGRLDTAEAGTMNILAAGNPTDLEKVAPIFEVLGSKTWLLGDQPEQANVVKIAANFMISCVIESLGESFALVESYGIKSQSFLDMLTSTLFNAPAYKNYGKLITEQQYTPAGFKLSLGLKDTKLALAAGDSTSVALPFASIMRDHYLQAIAHGDEDLDWSALATVAMRNAGQKQ